MKKIRTLIVDDEPLARQGVELLLLRDRDIEVIGQCADAKSGLAAIQKMRPDLLFLDIQMPPFDGFELLAQVKAADRPFVVFVTAYEQHAVHAFDVAAVDYLLKPYSDSRFAEALERAKSAIHRQEGGALTQRVEELLSYVKKIDRVETGSSEANSNAAESFPAEYADRIVLKADGALHFIRVSEVIWIEAQGDFVKVQTTTKPQLVRETLHSIEKKLEATKFLRIHRSYIVNLEHVIRVETALYGDYSVYMNDGTKLRLSRNYRSKLKALINQASPNGNHG